MKIIPVFQNGNQYWKEFVTHSSAQASAVLSDPLFIAKVRNWHGFDFCDESPDQVASIIEKAGDVRINVGFYSSFWTRAIAYEVESGVYFNTRKEKYGAGGVGNVAHELIHKLGFHHNGNSPAGNQNTVPYRIGEWASTWVVVHPAIAQAVAAETVS